MSYKSQNKGKQLHVFSEQIVETWRKSLQDDAEVFEIFNNLISARDASMQLSLVRKITSQLNHYPPHTHTKPMIKCLVEMHSLCTSRHPLQRNIARCLDTLSMSHYDIEVHDTIVNRLNELLYETYCIDYIQSLMEHYPPGERVMKEMIPYVLKQLINFVQSQQCNRSDSKHFELFISAIKVLLNVLHHCSSILIQLVKSCDIPHDMSYTDEVQVSDLKWPIDSSTESGCGQWLIHQLNIILSVCSDILRNDNHLPRDLLLSVAMLYVVTMTTCYPLSIEIRIRELYTTWLSTLSDNSFSQLALCHALIAKLSPTQLVSVNINNDLIMFQLFPILCSLLNQFTETSHRYMASKTLAMWTSVLKTCVNLPMMDNRREELSPNSRIVTTLLNFIWSLWEDPVESIRQQCKIIFESLINLYLHLREKVQGEQDYLLALSRPLLSLPSPTRGKYSLLASLVPHISVNEVLMEWPNLPYEIMDTMGHQILACKAGELWNEMIVKHHQEIKGDTNVWKQTWIIPLITCILEGSTLAKQHVKQYCLSIVLSMCSESLDILNQIIGKLSHDLSCDSADILTARLACLRYAIVNGHCVTLDSYIGLLNIAVCHNDEQIVISALQLLCESKKSTELIPLVNLSVILNCLILHMNSQSPGFRNQVINTMKKLLSRICESTHYHLRIERKTKTSNDLKMEDYIKRYKEFLQTLSCNCLQVLHPLSSFQRRYFALSLLHLMSIILDTSQEYEFSSLVSDQEGKSLVYILYDTFDDNRILILNIMDKLSLQKLGLEEESKAISLLVLQCHQLIISPKSTDCSAGYRLIQFLIKRLLKPFANLLASIASIPSLSETECDTTSVIQSLLTVVNRHMISAEQSLVDASINTPMYGIIQSIRGVWEEINFRTSSEVLQRIMNDVMMTCVRIGEMVSPVVCNSSPEGFLPTREEEGKEILDDERKVTLGYRGNAQSVLVCCWRCMKEVILLISTIIDMCNGNTSLSLTHDQFDIVSGLLIKQLTEARHRGAFEMAYVGFTKLCQYLWTTNDPRLNSKPKQWTKDLLESLQSSSMTQLLSITRRSAGLPFYIQAILTTEPNFTDRANLKHVMSLLISIASSHSSSTQSETDGSFQLVPQPSSVHALNILRGLFRDTKLGEYVIPYVTEGLQIAIKGFTANYWPVRNSCTLLFSALIVRVFGVKRVQDERSLENKMTSREFFSRFPSLHNFLLSTITKSVETESSESLFPVLLLLSRLYPSPLDDTQSPLSLTPFQDPIIKAAASPIWKCRVLASQSLLPTLSSPNLSNILHSLIDELSINDQNKLHGLMLMIISILGHATPLQEGLGSLLKIEMDLMSLMLCRLVEKDYIGSRKNTCHITRGQYLDCVTQLLNKVNSPCLSPLQHSKLLNLMKETREDLTSGGYEGVPLTFELPSSQFEFMKAAIPLFKDFDISSITVDSWKCHHSVDVIYKTLVDVVIRGDLNEEEEKKLAILCVEKAQNGIINCYKMLTILMERWINNTVCIEPVSDLFHTTVSSLCDGFLREELKISMMQFISLYMKHFDINDDKESLYQLLSIMITWCNETHPDTVRESIASFLGQNWTVLVSIDKPANDQSLQSQSFMFWFMVVTLLQDIEEGVRNTMCCAIRDMLNHISGNPEERDVYSCQQSTLHKLILAIPIIYNEKPVTAVELLIYLADIEYDKPNNLQDNVSSILFEEDKINSYTEPVQLLLYISEALKIVLPLIDPQSPVIRELIDSLVASGEANVNNIWLLKSEEIMKIFKLQYLKPISDITIIR